jgi:hypothetical protein
MMQVGALQQVAQHAVQIPVEDLQRLHAIRVPDDDNDDDGNMMMEI